VIIAEGTWWPIVMVGAVADRQATGAQVLVMSDRFLKLSERLALGFVVSGRGTEAMAAQRSILEWWRLRQRWLMPRTRSLAWVVLDDDVRQSTEGWIDLMNSTSGAHRRAVFSEVKTAVGWLLETPWPLMTQRSERRGESRTASTVIHQWVARWRPYENELISSEAIR
jgi:hypothetical protein